MLQTIFWILYFKRTVSYTAPPACENCAGNMGIQILCHFSVLTNHVQGIIKGYLSHLKLFLSKFMENYVLAVYPKFFQPWLAVHYPVTQTFILHGNRWTSTFILYGSQWTSTFILHGNQWTSTLILHDNQWTSTFILHGNHWTLTFILHGSQWTLTFILHGNQWKLKSCLKPNITSTSLAEGSNPYKVWDRSQF